MGSGKYRGLVNPDKDHFNGSVLTHEDVLDVTLGWKRPQRVFVDSMSDLLHPGVPDDFIRRTFDVMARADWHAFRVLTKRPDRAAEMAGSIPWPPNVLVGASVEDQDVLERVDALRRMPAYVQFSSCESLLGPLSDLDLGGIGWVIVGGESGKGGPMRPVKPMDPDWVRGLRDQCVAAGVPFHFKQWGRYDADGCPVGKEASGRALDGRTRDEHPAVLGFADPRAVGHAVPPPFSDAGWQTVAPVLAGRPGTPGR